MAHELAINRTHVGANYDLEDYVKIMRLYGGKKQVVSDAFRSAIHELVKEVKPTAADIREVAKLREANLAKRYQKRVTDARLRGETCVDMLNSEGKSGKRGRKPATYGGNRPSQRR